VENEDEAIEAFNCDASGGVSVAAVWREDPYDPSCPKFYLVVSNGWNAPVVVDYAWQWAGGSTWAAWHLELNPLETREEWVGNCSWREWAVSGEIRYCVSFGEAGCEDRCGIRECNGQTTCE